jgi:uncharacterized Rossmann fold enzyme
MEKLELTVQAYGDPNELRANIRSALARKLPELAPAPCAHDGTFVCVASGWSMPDYVNEIRAHQKAGRPIVSVKAAHDFLCENGIKPELWVNLDPRDRTEHIKHANDYTVYMVASRCAPVTFDKLSGKRVLLWHSWTDSDEQKAFPAGKLAIGGGTTSGMRAINIGYILGYRKFVLYGYDSCNRADGVKRFTGEMTGPTLDVYVGDGADRQKFVCNAAMAQQANEFQMIYSVMPDITVEAKGPGLIAAIIDERKRLKFAA